MLNRRNFIKTIGITGLAIASGGCAERIILEKSKPKEVDQPLQSFFDIFREDEWPKGVIPEYPLDLAFSGCDDIKACTYGRVSRGSFILVPFVHNADTPQSILDKYAWNNLLGICPITRCNNIKDFLDQAWSRFTVTDFFSYGNRKKLFCEHDVGVHFRFHTRELKNYKDCIVAVDNNHDNFIKVVEQDTGCFNYVIMDVNKVLVGKLLGR